MLLPPIKQARRLPAHLYKARRGLRQIGLLKPRSVIAMTQIKPFAA
jgi:hypothetical protein